MTEMLKEINEQQTVLDGIEEANKETIKNLVAELRSRNITKAVFSGRGTSDHAGIYGQYLLGIYKGIVSSSATPSCISAYGASMCFEDCLVVGVSQSGQAADALAVIKHGNDKGAVTVSITNNVNSPMANAAKYHLYCNAGPEKSVAATKTFSAQMFLLGLFTAYWSGDGSLLQALREVPKHVGQLVRRLPDGFERYVDRFRYCGDGMVLARGFCYPIALEAALKLQETCYIKMKGYAVPDFYHGPIAQTDNSAGIIMFLPKGKVFMDTLAMLDKLHEKHIQVLVVTDDEDLHDRHDHILILPFINCEAASAFMFAVFAQCFAQYLSVSKGLDPDSPRFLKKVTVTL